MRPIVYVIFAEALSAPEVAWSLIDAGFEVIVIARRGRRSALRHSLHVTVREITPPEQNSTLALAELGELMQGLNPEAGKIITLFPLDDTAIWLCSQIRTQPGLVLVGPTGTNVELALNKRMQVEAAQAAGLNVPATTFANTGAEVLARRADLPLVLRPADAVLLKNERLFKARNWICASELELNKAVENWAGTCSLLVQPFISGVGEGIFGLATNERVEAWSAHRRLRMMNPHGSGSSACVSQPVTEKTKIAIEELIRNTKWRGLFMVELLRDDHGAHWFVEFNGRPWGSMALSRRQGLEYPAWAVNWTLNPAVHADTSSVRERPLLCRNVGRELLHLLFVARGPKSAALTRWPSFWRTAYDLIRIHPNDSVYNWRRGDLRVFATDCWYTIRGALFKTSG